MSLSNDRRAAVIAAGVSFVVALLGGAFTITAAVTRIEGSDDTVRADFLRGRREEAYADFLADFEIFDDAILDATDPGDDVTRDECPVLTDLDDKYNQLRRDYKVIELTVDPKNVVQPAASRLAGVLLPREPRGRRSL